MKPQNRTVDLVVQESGKELLIYDLIRNRALCLNKSSRAIWKACDGFKNLSDIRLRVESELGKEVSEDFIRFGLEELGQKNLIIGTSLEKTRTHNRRQLIRNLALGSAAALPVVSSIVAPTAANAQSMATCVPACAGGQTCCSGTCTDISTDSQNCGGCGIICDDGNAMTVDTCVAGGCVFT